MLYPLDTITKCMQVIGSKGYSSVERGLMNTIKSINKTYGIRGFYKGVHLAALKIIPTIYLQLLIYDYLRQYTIMADPESETKSNEKSTNLVSAIPQQSATV